MHRSHLLLAGLLVVAGACAADSDEPAAIDAESIPEAADDTPPADTSTTTATTAAADDTTTATEPPTDGDTVTTDAPSAVDATTTPVTETTMPGPPTPSPEALYEAGNIDQGLQPFIAQATDDLAARLEVDAASITAHSAVLVEWPDASLGCPAPDMRYAQVLTDGSIIELEHDGSIYRYHTGGRRGPFMCEQPLTKAEAPDPIELDTTGGADS